MYGFYTQFSYVAVMPDGKTMSFVSEEEYLEYLKENYQESEEQ